ncbi:hypothetical protein D9613_011703 [Agrocybe pediades]|uniref:Uncharacterized protein n=1 Tax=Agrocybe pediades TaxID=84607 RepID=A0A8H4QW62_9AGAR|nr:hypothetical protein D9613_011703 [Agrocybe pediades]
MEPTAVSGTHSSSSGSLKDSEKKLGKDEVATAYGIDEKAYSDTDGKADSTDTSNVGDVFAEGPRLIDLGEDGKERPIDTDVDYATRLISLDDDTTLPIWTFRMWFLSLGLSCFGAVLGQIFYFRPQTVSVSQLFLQIISYIMGKAMEEVLPGPGSERFKTADTRFWRWVNPGPFNIKEHVAITVMASTASSSALAISIFAAQDLYYNVRPNAGVGIMRSFLVYPTFAVYPQLMPTVQLFEALHKGQSAVMQKKRLKFFWIIFIAIFVWEWFPEYIAPTLTGISIFCLANQKSAWFTRIFGGAAGNEGLGVFSICFDWAYVGAGGGSIGSLFTPLSTQLSLYGGTAVCIIAFCACYARNTWNTQNFPFLTQLLYYENGTEYDQLSILNDDFTLNMDKLAVQGLPWYAASQLLYKISRTMYIGAAITHFFLWHFKTVYNIVKDWRNGECQDPHYQKMKVYKEISNWWYLGIFVVTTGIALGTTYAAKSGLPWWGLFIALIFAWLFVPIIGTLNATVGYAPSIENMVQMVGGAVIPGKPVANMYFTMYGYNPVVQSLALLRDLKMGQYAKLPPSVTFATQFIGTIIVRVFSSSSSSLANFKCIVLALGWIVKLRYHEAANREVLRDVQGTNVWSGQQVQSYNSAAVAWGALGKPLYATGTRYGFVPYMLLAGLGFPIPFWLLHRKYPKVGFNYVFTPVLVGNVGINSSIFTSFLLAIFSQYYLRKYRATWFRKYNFLLSAALDGGTSVMVFVYTFAVGGGSGTVTPFPTWALNPKGNPDYCARLT